MKFFVKLAFFSESKNEAVTFAENPNISLSLWSMKLSVIISTYNAEEWLHKVLLGYAIQTLQDFEIIVADDGSTTKTKEVIQQFQDKFKHPILHVWHEDEGFRKCKILNKAIVQSSADYLLFTDGDCIPRNDFVANHLKQKE
jgi:glycosyltransferase involved in cell wall biosynthesis